MTRALLSRAFNRFQKPAQHVLGRNASTFRTQNPNLNQKSHRPQAQSRDHNSDRLFRADHRNTNEDDVVLGAHVVAAAQRHDIGPPTQLRRLPVQLKSNKGKLRFLYSTRHLFDRNDLKWFGRLEHPSAGTVLERYAEWSSGARPFWWSVNTFGDAAPFVCTTAQRRLNRGIRLALGERGYDPVGKRLVEASHGQRIQSPQELYGTLRVMCPNPKDLCQLESAELLSIGRTVIAAAEIQLAVKPGQRSIESNPQNRISRYDPRQSRPGPKSQKQVPRSTSNGPHSRRSPQDSSAWHPQGPRKQR